MLCLACPVTAGPSCDRPTHGSSQTTDAEDLVYECHAGHASARRWPVVSYSLDLPSASAGLRSNRLVRATATVATASARWRYGRRQPAAKLHKWRAGIHRDDQVRSRAKRDHAKLLSGRDVRALARPPDDPARQQTSNLHDQDRAAHGVQSDLAAAVPVRPLKVASLARSHCPDPARQRSPGTRATIDVDVVQREEDAHSVATAARRTTDRQAGPTPITMPSAGAYSRRGSGDEAPHTDRGRTPRCRRPVRARASPASGRQRQSSPANERSSQPRTASLRGQCHNTVGRPRARTRSWNRATCTPRNTGNATRGSASPGVGIGVGRGCGSDEPLIWDGVTRWVVVGWRACGAAPAGVGGAPNKGGNPWRDERPWRGGRRRHGLCAYRGRACPLDRRCRSHRTRVRRSVYRPGG